MSRRNVIAALVLIAVLALVFAFARSCHNPTPDTPFGEGEPEESVSTHHHQKVPASESPLLDDRPQSGMHEQTTRQDYIS